MGFKKFKADHFFNGDQILDGEHVLITDDEGMIADVIQFDDAGEDVQQFPGILSPGFVNCHCHLELSHMKGFIQEKTGLVRFVLDVVQQRHFPEEQILTAIEKAEDEMLDNGIVAAGDICNNTLTIPQKAKGRVYYHNFIEASGFNPEIALQRFERSLDIFRQYASLYSIPVDSNSIVPHAPYSVSDDLWQLIINFPGNHLMMIHNQETIGEDEWFVNKTGEFEELYKQMNIDPEFFNPSGKTSLQSFLGKFKHNQSVILVHNVHTSANDIEFAKRSGLNLYWCLCPNANQYITGNLPDLDLLIKQDCNIVLGTDSLASNHQLSILEEIKTIQKHFPKTPIGFLLKCATSNGANALQMDSLLGNFEKGKRPGIILIENDLSSVKRLI